MERAGLPNVAAIAVHDALRRIGRGCERVAADWTWSMAWEAYACQTLSTGEDKWLRTLSAEQKLLGGPLSVTGAVSETGAGDTAKSLKAGFKRTW